MIGKKYTVRINTPNKSFIIKGKLVRSPFEAVVSESELRQIKTKIKSDSISDYSISETDSFPMYQPAEDKPIETQITQDIVAVTHPKIEELKIKSKSILEKYIDKMD